VNAALLRLGLVGANRPRVAVALEHRVHVARRQADLDREARERGRVADRLALAEIGAEEAFLERGVELVLGRPVQQAVRVERVAGADAIEAQRKPVGRGGGRHRADHRFGLRERRPVLAREALGVRAAGVALARRGGVELERAAADDDVEVEALERDREARARDVAPRARDVRPDVDLEAGRLRAEMHG
jgi:hypothetical protein